MSTTTSTLVDNSFFARIRRNHGLEHATLHILSKRFPRQSMAGYSDWRGFWIIADVPLEEVQIAVETARKRMRAGERELAVHPNCGTNFVVSGILAGIGATLALFGVGQRKRDWLERMPLVATMATLALIMAQPLGLLIQSRLTTSADLGDMQVVEIFSGRRGPLPAYRVLTRG